MIINRPVIFKKLTFFLVLIGTSFGLECDSSGISCISCTDYQACSAGVPEGEIISCKNGKACADSNLEECWVKLDCYGANNCTEVGIFPNVMVESDYFVCLGDLTSGYLKYEFSCPEGNFFDTSASMCTPKAATETFTETSLETTTTPESSASTDVTDPISSFPTSSDVPTTTISSVSPEIQTTPSSTPSTPSTPTPTPTTTTSTTTTEISPACIASGIYPYPSNCKMYYRCSTSLKLFLYICPGTSYFNENILKCSMNISPACQEQIQKNSTATTKPPTTTSTTTTTTTTLSPPSTTTTTTPSSITAKTTPSTTITSTTKRTTTTTSPLPTPFTCPTAGTFENPVDCKTYFRCSSLGKPFLYTCPGSSYFNELTKRCSMVITPRCKSLIQG